MRAARRDALALAGAALVLAGGDCGGGSGSGGSAVVEVESGDCQALGDQFPPALAFVPGASQRLLVAEPPSAVVEFDVDSDPPLLAQTIPIPPDADGNGFPEFISPILDGVFAFRSDFAAVTASAAELVVFTDPDRGSMREVWVEVPASFAPGENPLLPAPGTRALQTGISTFACVVPDPNAVDSRGTPLSQVLDPRFYCDGTGALSFGPNFTSGAAFIADRLFVSMSNIADSGDDPQFVPGAVLVYDLDLSQDPPVVGPNPTAPAIVTTGFNPTHVDAVAVGGRELVLVTVSGALAIVDGQGEPRSDSSIDVIDARSLELVATIPLGPAALATDPLAIDPTGTVAVATSQVDRVLYAVDLRPLASPTLPTTGPPIVLDGSAGAADAVVFDTDRPFDLPALPDGAPPQCGAFTVGAAFNDAGDLVYVTEFCDGSLSIVEVDLSAPLPAPVPPDRFRVRDVRPVVAPIRPDTDGDERRLGSVAVRPGRPGADFSGPDVYALEGEIGSLCSVRVESP